MKAPGGGVAFVSTRRPRREAALVAYVMAGHPSPDEFPDLLCRVARAADVVEIGVPFSDPMADGVTLQRASRSALRQGTTLRGLVATLRELAPSIEKPLFLMSYLNPLLAYGVDRLAADLAGLVAGLIVPDLPLEESTPVAGALERKGLGLVLLVTPATSSARRARVCATSRPFVYAVTLRGTTGRDILVDDALARYLGGVCADSPVPVYAGFGVKTAEQAAAIAEHADGVVVGSALVEHVEAGGDPTTFLNAMRTAVQGRGGSVSRGAGS